MERLSGHGRRAGATSQQVVGRTAELALLDAALARMSGSPFVLITGEPGIGKSSLLAAFLEQSRSRLGMRSLHGHCLDVGRATIPYAPFVTVLRSLANEYPGDGHVAKAARDALTKILPAVDGSPDGRRWSPTAMPTPNQPGRLAFFQVMLDLLERIGRRGRVMLSIDDLQWADDSTLGLVEFLVRSGAPERLLITCTARTPPQRNEAQFRRLIAEMRRQHLVELLPLGPLDLAATGELVASLRGAANDQYVAWVHERTGGNPFFIEALVAEGDSATTVPLSLREVLTDQLARLPNTALGLARVLAIASSGLPIGVLATAAEMSERDARAAGDDEPFKRTVDDEGSESVAFRHNLLKDAMALELSTTERRRIHERVAVALEEVRHSSSYLVARAVHWEAAGDGQRAAVAYFAAAQQLSNGIAPEGAAASFERAAALRDRSGNGSYSPAVELPSAALLLTAAADQLTVAGDLHRAESTARRAQRVALESSDIETWVRAGLVSVFVMYRSGFEDRAEQLLADMVTRVRDQPDASGALAFLLSELGFTRAVLGRAPEGLALCREAVAIATREGDDVIAAEAGIKLTYALHTLDRVAESRVILEQSWRRMSKTRSLTQFTSESPWCSPSFMAANAVEAWVELGEYRTALDVVAWAKGIGEDESPFNVAHLGGQRGVPGQSLVDVIGALALHRLGRWSDALLVLDQLTGAPDPVVLVLYHGIRANILSASGHFDGAQRAIDLGRAALDAVPEPTSRVFLDEAVVEMALWQQRPDAVRGIVASALRVIEHMPNRNVLALPLHAARLRAEAEELTTSPRRSASAQTLAAQLRQSAIDEAVAALSSMSATELTPPANVMREQCCVHIDAFAGQIDAHRWEEVARRWHVLGRRYEQAYSLYQAGLSSLEEGPARVAESLVAAHEICVSIGAQPLARAVARAARKVGVALRTGHREGQPNDRRNDGGLSERELEVVRLVAQGATNREIATTLLITEKTAGIHVSNILRKLDVPNRGQAAAWARRLVP